MHYMTFERNIKISEAAKEQIKAAIQNSVFKDYRCIVHTFGHGPNVEAYLTDITGCFSLRNRAKAYPKQYIELREEIARILQNAETSIVARGFEYHNITIIGRPLPVARVKSL